MSLHSNMYISSEVDAFGRCIVVLFFQCIFMQTLKYLPLNCLSVASSASTASLGSGWFSAGRFACCYCSFSVTRESITICSGRKKCTYTGNVTAELIQEQTVNMTSYTESLPLLFTVFRGGFVENLASFELAQFT